MPLRLFCAKNHPVFGSANQSRMEQENKLRKWQQYTSRPAIPSSNALLDGSVVGPVCVDILSKL